jgi:hypothetical protein
MKHDESLFWAKLIEIYQIKFNIFGILVKKLFQHFSTSLYLIT